MQRIRYITKIARNLELYKRKNIKNDMNYSTELTLHLIRHNKGITAEEISRALCLDKALITRIIKKLIDEALVVREVNEDDKRSFKLYPTKKCEELKKEIVNYEEEYYKMVLSVLTEEELETFLNLLEKVYIRSKDIRKKGI